MYDAVNDVLQDYKQAYIWFGLAVANGEKTAQKSLDVVAKKLDIKTLSEAQNEVRTLLEQ